MILLLKIFLMLKKFNIKMQKKYFFFGWFQFLRSKISDLKICKNFEIIYKPNFVLFQCLLLELYLILLLVLNLNHCGNGLFCFCFLAKTFLTFKDLCGAIFFWCKKEDFSLFSVSS